MAFCSDLRLGLGKKFVLVGTPEGDEIKDPSQLENPPDVVNDLDVDFSDNLDASAAYKNDQRNIRKIKEASDNLDVNIIYPLRPGKKLLVLDIDYTILDTRPLTSGSLPPAECARPFLHEFLEAIYPYYDKFIKIQVTDQLDLARDKASRARNDWFKSQLPDLFRFGQDMYVHCVY
ncbi:hypothetical protein C0995_007187 [Termitomyces sp. Mi166|nr:hypothetical protein C0995_007187 [Termitomyces sp. Mi166\